jgi:DNA polymerase II small subunit/DNA polymerase delta subunit B
LQENAVDESEIASVKKNINDALEADYHDRMQELDSRFTELKLGTPVQEDYALMRDAISKLQEQIRDSNDLEYTEDDYEEVTKEFYEELLDEVGSRDRRGKVVVDFVIDRLKSILDDFEVGDE